jgi:LAO/AO transport system kinase
MLNFVKMNLEQIVEGIISKNRRCLSRAITLVESTNNAHRQIAAELLHTLSQLTKENSSKRIGITGPPGVGKSSFIESFGLFLLQQNYSVAVVAIDPSSKVSHGSILGDKIRMNTLSVHPQALVRPVPSGSMLGGVSMNTSQILTVLEYAGFDFILVETLGVGQSETMVYDVTDMFVHLYNPLSGDEIQGIKRGIMELSDLFLITKCDGNFIHEALLTENKLRNALSFLRPTYEEWKTEIIRTSSLEAINFENILETINSFFSKNAILIRSRERREKQLELQSAERIKNTLMEIIISDECTRKKYEKLLRDIQYGKITEIEAGRELLKSFTENANLSKDMLQNEKA